MKDFIIIAHRGASAYAKENSRLAIQNAYKLEADGVEIDVRQTKDGELVCFHDKDLKKYGYNKLVSELSLLELKKVDSSIVSLADVADLLRLFRYVILDIKEVAEVENVLNFTKNLKNVILVTGYLEVLKEIRKKDQRIETGFWFYKPINLEELLPFNIQYVKPMFKIASDELIERAHNYGKKVLVWTVDDPRLAKIFYNAGADGIVTDQPDVIRRAIFS
jgi:glycerophosphoryl diester phosphodiesterase